VLTPEVKARPEHAVRQESGMGHAGNRIEIAGKYGHNLAFLTAIPHNRIE
jgi:hypothetical protein